jgi:hypothetical protein
MTDTQLKSALARLAPQVDDTPAWDDVVRRAEPDARFRWRLAVVAVAMFLTAGVVAGAVAEGFLTGTLDRLSSWVGDQPGEPAPEEQAVFDEQNAASYAHFPNGTRVGRLLSFEYGGRSYRLLGFRDGPNLCLRIIPSFLGSPQANEAECAPQSELTRLGDPVATIGGYVRIRPNADGPGLTMLYGLAADDVASIDVLVGGELLAEATVQNNGFLIAADDQALGRPPDYPSVVLRASDGHGASADVPVVVDPQIRNPDPEDLPGPAQVDREPAHSSIGWLVRGENRGDPFTWQDESAPFAQRILFARAVTPDPNSSFRVALGYGEGSDGHTVRRWYCLTWLAPLIPGPNPRGCLAWADDVDTSGWMITGGGKTLAEQFPHWIGIATDEIARLEVFHADGTSEAVPYNDNVFSFYTRRDEPSKLVGYDEAGRVVKIEVLRW